MDFDLRLKALGSLAESKTQEAEAALRKELKKVASSLSADTQYDSLEQHLDVLDAIGYRFSNEALATLLTFIKQIESRPITSDGDDRLLDMESSEYRNAASLIVRAIEALTRLRYLETKPVLLALVELSQHTQPNVRKKALEALKALASYDISVFYGDGKQPGIGAAPQQDIIEQIEALSDADLRRFFTPLATLVDGLLSVTMHGTSWAYKSVTLSRAATPALPSVAHVRLRTITLLKRMYALSVATSEKLHLVSLFSDATRTHGWGSSNEDITQMIARDSVDVLHFFASVVGEEDLPVIQKIEHDSYWIFYHASRDEVREAALAVYGVISVHYEYQIYKTLIGFEGIFGDWSTLRAGDARWEGIDEFRKEKASEYVASISFQNFAEWRRRILRYAETQSDDLATFPIFFHFLTLLAVSHPKLALELISKDHKKIDRFLIPLLRGLWGGPQRVAAKALVESWISQGRYLPQSAKQFLDSNDVDRELLAAILSKAIEMKDVRTVATVISVAVSNYSEDKAFLVDAFFLPAIEVLTSHSDTSWIHDFWFRREIRTLIEQLSERGLDLILSNLLLLEKIDYHAEQILYLIAQRQARKVLKFLCLRLAHTEKGARLSSSIFDAIPYEFHKLHEPLSRIPKEAVEVVRQHYDGNYGMFIYGGGHLLKSVFPEFAPEFEAELIRLVKAGDNANLEFVLAVLRNYEGEPFIHRVCREIIKVVPPDSPLRTEVAVALEQTGVVAGEYGLAEAYERKASEVKDWLNDPDERIQEFAKWYITGLEQMSAADRKRAEEEIALRKHRYGE